MKFIHIYIHIYKLINPIKSSGESPRCLSSLWQWRPSWCLGFSGCRYQQNLVTYLEIGVPQVTMGFN